METAKIHAETIIRNKKEALNLRRFGVKMGALASKLESAHRTQQMSESIGKSVPLLQKAMKQMDSMGVSNDFFSDLVCIQVMGSMEAFENVFEDLDVKTGEMNDAMDTVYSNSIDQGEVMSLLTQLQAENGMAVGGELAAAGSNGIAQPGAADQNGIDEMQAKLNQLKGL